MVIWEVSSGSPDYTYKFGEGSIQGNMYTVTFASAPPAEAINSYGVAVGFVTAVDQSFQLADGRIDDSIAVQARGYTVGAILWKGAAASGTSPEWSAGFNAGYSCGSCVQSNDDQVFDSFSPLDCSMLPLETASDLSTIDSCNWT